MKKLISLFEENFKPYATIPGIGLTEIFILKNGFNLNDIDQLICDGEIERHGESGYRMTRKHVKKWAGSSYKYLPCIARW